MVVHGQVHGGIAQGIGQALLEGAVYNDDGQLLTASYMDYCMPRADNLPSFNVDTIETACPSNPLGIKGCGEAGAIASPPAVINAITDALGHEDVTMPATPQVVWRAAQKAHAEARRGMIRAGGGRRAASPDPHSETSPCTLSNIIVRRRSRARSPTSPTADAKALAGGQTLLPTMKQRLASPSALVELDERAGAARASRARATRSSSAR